ncbi:hypothetical protein [Nocardioides sp. TF02-7]|uniref:hypothetical protein n=1 Tax=Nocardioides sp. TF02-7 TaxID=2917724 RepID=UPI001F05DB0B|nr:hypothetical protein [Nocardioides sp. TF02-7]UMG94287.1 hypothetical protein MF408_09870 [Nocardioides sp. TF02-7]
MRTPHTWASRVAAVVTGGLTVLLVVSTALASGTPTTIATGVLTLLTGLATAKLVRDNCFESRLAAVVLAAVQLGGALLAVTVGLPGQEPQRTDPMALTALVLGAAVLVLVGLDHRTRRRGSSGAATGRGYAL